MIPNNEPSDGKTLYSGAYSPSDFEELSSVAWIDEVFSSKNLTALINDLGKDEFVDMVMRLDELGLGDIIFNANEITEQIQIPGGNTMAGNPLPPGYAPILDFFADVKNRSTLHAAAALYPNIDAIIASYQAYSVWKEEIDLEKQISVGKSFTDQLMARFGTGFEWAGDFLNTNQKLQDQFQWEFRRNSEYPETSLPWEFRLGAGRFSVPPISINVSQNFSVGSLTGGAIRQQQSPKFNSGHKETMISLTLYFPTHESIWGLGSDPEQDIDFATAPDSVIDRYLSSLRGLITQFKYAPFLPVKNEYLNSAWGITGVTLQSMSMATVEEFPFCMAVNLQLLKFNHKVYLPMIEDFHQAIHWGKYRQYMGRAAEKLNSVTNEGFLIEKPGPVTNADGVMGWLEKFGPQPADTAEITYEGLPTTQFETPYKDYLSGTLNTGLDIYYPEKTPLKVFAPDTSSFRTKEEEMSPLREEAGWAVFLGRLGIQVSEDGQSDLDSVKNYSQNISLHPSEREKLLAYLHIIGNAAEVMTQERLDEYIAERLEDAAKGAPYHGNLPDNVAAEIELNARGFWFYYIFSTYRETPFFRSYLEQAEFSEGQFLIKEWDVPMGKFRLDPKKVVINGITVSMSNNFARLQVQMQNEPVHQHIGGGDTRLDVSMTIFGNEELGRLQNLFNHISNLAQLEHAHGVLGFLGVKNVLTAVAGIKYVLPLSFEVDTIPGYPGVFTCRLSFVDFDVFQQKRELLSSEQQQELVDAFGKRNPFLRIKQLWGSFNAYPDFPLSIRDKAGKVIGTIDPDFYFRSYQMIDDDVVNWGLPDVDSKYETKNDRLGNETIPNTLDEEGRQIETPERPSPSGEEGTNVKEIQPPTGFALPKYLPPKTGTSAMKPYDHKVHYYMGLYGENQDDLPVVEMSSRGMKLTTANKESGEIDKAFSPNFFLGEDTADRVHTKPLIDGLSPMSDHQKPLADGSQVPFKQFELMMKDTQYRDISGRMIRAFPTYMLWLIDEGGRFAGVKLFDNFYGLQSVIDFAVHQSEDVLGDTLVLHVSNLYQKLTTSYKDIISREGDNLADGTTPPTEDQSIANLIETPLNRARNLLSGLNDEYVVNLGSIRLKPGVRVHLRAGYSANPNALQTIFNGVITTVTAGDIVEIVAQSDAIELSPYVNTTDKKGHSGTLPGVGGINTGLWLSEPRDLMVRLLSMGSSSFKESFAHATKGMIFSENKFGIRHFGSILYAPMTDGEKEKQADRYLVVKNYADSVINDNSVGDLGGSAASGLGLDAGDAVTAATGNPVSAYSALYDSAVRSPVAAAAQNMWANFVNQRDYEIFKRNIYPGNGLGVAQFLGGDLLDGGVMVAETAGSDGVPFQFGEGAQRSGGLAAAGDSSDDAPVNDNFNPLDLDGDGATDSSADDSSLIEDAANIIGGAWDVWDSDLNPLKYHLDAYLGTTTAGTVGANTISSIGSLFSGGQHPILGAMGITAEDTDLPGFDEVSFRAQTYMKSVWDLFQLCAALLPNYIVAVRPFVDRSTVFYGKPHWLYTSDLIPLTTGIPKSGEGGPEYEEPNAELAALQREVLEGSDPLADLESQLGFFNELTKAGSTTDPYAITRGSDALGLTAEEVGAMALEHPSGATIPQHKGRTIIGQHIRTVNEPEDQPKALSPDALASGVHVVSPFLEEKYKWPSFRKEEPGCFGEIDKIEEQYYIAMKWPFDEGTQDMYRSGKRSNRRVLVFNERSGLACVCVPGDNFTNNSTDAVAKISPESAYAIEFEEDDVCYFGWMPDGTRLGGYRSTGRLPTEEDPSALNATVPVGPDEVNFNYDFVPDTAEDIYNTNPIQYAYDYGWKNDDVPVFIPPDGGAGQVSGAYNDRIGHLARLMYDQDYNLGLEDGASLADRIEAGGSASAYQKAKDAFFPGDLSRGSDWAEIIWDTLRDQWPDYFDWAKLDYVEAFESLPRGETDDSDPGGVSHAYRNYADNFIQALWQSEIGRAWVVLIADRTLDPTSYGGVDFDVPDIVPDILPDGLDDAEGDGSSGGVSFGDDVEFNFGPPGVDNAQPLRKAWRFFLSGDFGGPDVINQHEGTELTDEAIRARDGFFRQILSPEVYAEGSDDSNLVAGTLGAAEDLWDGTVGKLISASAQALSGLVALYRMNLMQLGEGLDMLGAMQKQANILNKVYNDSIYYAEGQPGDLLRLADNPFTREYGEPVVEVREPFQKMHHLSSFQHILDNKISENLENVATVVTASSDGKYPVSVYLDKGAPSERQVEKAVETGLFWDNVRGGGFFGFLHPILHPVETGRGIVKSATGSSDTILSKRVGLYHLKESLKDIYTGELIILGDPDIKPHDLVYIADLYERMYGMFEVESIIHDFSPESGFTSRITPNAIVTINDPARWSVISWAWSWWSVQNTRDDVRSLLNIKADGSSQIASSGVTTEELAHALETQSKGHIQFSQGNSALIRDISATMASGLTYSSLDRVEDAQAQGDGMFGVYGAAVAGLPVANLFAGAVLWPAWEWVRDNLLDQHGCYIQYLNKDGQAMDAGLSYNQGVAVGTHHSTNLLPGILGLDVDTLDQNGYARITTNDLLTQLGWQEVDVQSLQRYENWWVEQIQTEILNVSGNSPDANIGLIGLGNNAQYKVVTVKSVLDGDTFITEEDGPNIRLAGVNTEELRAKYDVEMNAETELSEQARRFLERRLITDPSELGYDARVVLRINTTENGGVDTFGRTLATVFHNVPAGTPPEERVDKLMELATRKQPFIDWNAYLPDGRPYTMNWELVMAGLAQITLYPITRNDPDRGALGRGDN